MDKVIYLCEECNWKGTHDEMKSEQDLTYDQDCCPKCNNILFDNLYGYTYCKKVEEIRAEKLKKLL